MQKLVQRFLYSFIVKIVWVHQHTGTTAEWSTCLWMNVHYVLMS